jgi:hypothetical protein
MPSKTKSQEKETDTTIDNDPFGAPPPPPPPSTFDPFGDAPLPSREPSPDPFGGNIQQNVNNGNQPNVPLGDVFGAPPADNDPPQDVPQDFPDAPPPPPTFDPFAE